MKNRPYPHRKQSPPRRQKSSAAKEKTAPDQTRAQGEGRRKTGRKTQSRRAQGEAPAKKAAAKPVKENQEISSLFKKEIGGTRRPALGLRPHGHGPTATGWTDWRPARAGGIHFLFIYASVPASRIRPLTKELFLFLRPAQRPAPAEVIDARGKSLNPLPESRALPQSNAPSAIMPAPPSSLEAFGCSLFGCAPENYARLSTEDRARCPPPGEGLAKRDDRDLLTPPRSRVKDEA